MVLCTTVYCFVCEGQGRLQRYEILQMLPIWFDLLHGIETRQDKCIDPAVLLRSFVFFPLLISGLCQILSRVWTKF